MSKTLNEHIDAEMEKLVKGDGEKYIFRDALRKSLKSIAYKSIDAVRVEEEKDSEKMGNYAFLFTKGRNQAIQKSAQKEKEFKGV